MMSFFHTLAVRRPNIEGDWIEILIPVVIIIVYAISGILKMRSNLKDESGARQTPTRYRPLDQEQEWQQPGGETTDRESQHLETMLQVRPTAAPAPAVRHRPVPVQTQSSSPEQRRTLDAFLATQAPKSLAERIAEARAKAEAVAKAQAAARPQPSRPRAPEQIEAAQTRKPVRLAPTVPAGAQPRPQPETPRQPAPPLPTTMGDLTQLDTLRRAIIYSEILGIPAAFREMEF